MTIDDTFIRAKFNEYCNNLPEDAEDLLKEMEKAFLAGWKAAMLHTAEQLSNVEVKPFPKSDGGVW